MDIKPKKEHNYSQKVNYQSNSTIGSTSFDNQTSAEQMKQISPRERYFNRKNTVPNSEQSKNKKGSFFSLERVLTFLAYAIPLAFLLYVLYINFLPFGYNKTFTIDVGAEGDTDSSKAFYLQPSKDLSEKKVAEDGTTYRELNGMANVVFKPGVVLKDAEITLEVEGDGVEIIPPYIDFNPDDYEWDYSWDFTKDPKTNNVFRAEISEAVREELLEDAQKPAVEKIKLPTGESIEKQLDMTVAEKEGLTPEEYLKEATTLTGDAFPFEGCMYFDGKSKLELPHTADKFEDGPFTVYVEWKPEDDTKDYQEIIGHYNWEILQYKNRVRLVIGRMNNHQGKFYDLFHLFNKKNNTFNNKTHSLMAIYNPMKKYIELSVDKKTIGKRYVTGSIWDEYGNKNLSLGKTYHLNNKKPNFQGCIYSIKIINTEIDRYKNATNKIKAQVNTNNARGVFEKFSITSKNTSLVNSVKIHLTK